MPDSQRERARTFWNWWSELAGKVSRDGGVDDALLDEAVRLLHEYDDALGLEVRSDASARELIITAYGDADHRQSVHDLVAMKPRLAGWRVHELRPAASESQFELDVEGRHFDSDDIVFEPLTSRDDPKLLGLEVYFRDAVGTPEDVRFAAAALAVQTIIGERSFMEDITELRLGRDGAKKPEDLIPVGQLPQFMEWRARKRRT